MHEGVVQRVSEVVTFVRGYCFEIVEVARGLAQPSPTQIVGWLPPPLSFLKVNVDASFSFSLQKACSGVIIWDEHGQIMGACSRLTTHVPSVFAAEAMAVVQWLHFASEMGCLGSH
ncbi:hypothetical protein Goshw_016652, partial [Gossypium schwendimanii]|nr:hypothetical protein [Gossypium schwendimanii]